jgi:hypothetical protein
MVSTCFYFICRLFYFFQGLNSQELTISSLLLQSSISEWRVDFTVITTTHGISITSAASMIYKINRRPSGGTCSVDKSSGYAKQTYFNITCQNWTDIDGIVVKYEYFGNNFN